MRKANHHEQASGNSPKTPQASRIQGNNGVDDLLAVVPGNAMTPLKRVPILANFEEWMKMATDNKINATNSWNFALIDYFHDMSLLREGDSVNFQKASCTLDGCVKIYTSRVDSVATETGKLLSGLADNANRKQRRTEDGGDEDGNGVDDEEDEEGAKTRKRKRVGVFSSGDWLCSRYQAQHSSEATLAASFASLQLKKFELELNVDPLFKKTSADFDEGGAKGLLLNHLATDATGRIVFDSSDDGEKVANPSENESQTNLEMGSLETPTEENAAEIPVAMTGSDFDLAGLAKFIPDPGTLDTQDICPSLKNFDLADPNATLAMPQLKDTKQGLDDQNKDSVRRESGNSFGSGGFVAYEEEDEQAIAGLGISADVGFGDGGEVWVRDATLESPKVTQGANIEGELMGDDYDQTLADDVLENPGGSHSISLSYNRAEVNHGDILSYFDSSLKKNWAGPEHWRIRKVKSEAMAASQAPSTRKERGTFQVDFLSDLDSSLSESIYAPASSSSAISLPKAQWRCKTRNLLPDDKHFNSHQLLSLFLKPMARINTHKRVSLRSSQTKQEQNPKREVEEGFWAGEHGEKQKADFEEDQVKGSYDADFFQDDGLAFPGGIPDDDDEECFSDAREAFSPPVEDSSHDPANGTAASLNGIGGGYGSQLVTQNKRVRPDYVQYAKVAKKVDVRRLKEEMWKGIGLEKVWTSKNFTNLRLTFQGDPMDSDQRPPPSDNAEMGDKGLTFTSVMNGLRDNYSEQAMADISTSYCFICLLHLANEKNLSLENQAGLEDLQIY